MGPASLGLVVQLSCLRVAFALKIAAHAPTLAAVSSSDVASLSDDLHNLLTGPAAPITASRWSVSNGLLRDATTALAAAQRDDATPLFAEARRLCDDLLRTARANRPELGAVVKYSLKRNGNLSSPRACTRCMAELGILIATYSALAAVERPGFIEAVRPLTQTAPTAARVRSILVLCRGFWTPGFGSSGSRGSWYGGSGTVHGVLAGARVVPTPRIQDDATHAASIQRTPSLEALEKALTASESLRPHSRALRAALPFLDAPLQVWLQGIDASGSGSGTHAEGTSPQALEASGGAAAAADSTRAASALLVTLAEHAGDDGARLGQLVARWVVDALFESLERPTGERAPSASVVARAHGSDAALSLLLTHAPLVRGSSRQRRRWLSTVERVGHAVFLMAVAATEAVAETDATLGGCTQLPPGVGPQGSAAHPRPSQLVLERVRAVMLSCSLLERSDELRPRFRAAMSRAHTSPDYLWQLLAGALELRVSDSDAGGAANGGAAAETADGSARAVGAGGDRIDGPEGASLSGALGSAHVAAAASRLLAWPAPELVFKYLELHQGDESIAPLARRWMLALLGLDGERLHQLRCAAPPNARHFERLAAVSEEAGRAVAAWIAADAAGADDVSAHGSMRTSEAHTELVACRLPGVCDAASLFMMGEEMRTCMRIDSQCVRENAALLGYLVQGHVRVLCVSDAALNGESVSGANRAADGGERPRMAARAAVSSRSCAHRPLRAFDLPAAKPLAVCLLTTETPQLWLCWLRVCAPAGAPPRTR